MHLNIIGFDLWCLALQDGVERAICNFFCEATNTCEVS